MRMKKGWSRLAVCSLLVTSTLLSSGGLAEAVPKRTIPNTTKVEKSYDSSFLSVPGYASLGVNDRSQYIGTSYYRTVSNGREFLQAILDTSSGAVKVIEVTGDLNLGWEELALSPEERSLYSFISKYPNPSNGFTNPLLQASGVSKLNIANVDGLTIFSATGKTIRHVELSCRAPRTISSSAISALTKCGSGMIPDSIKRWAGHLLR